MLFEVYYIKIVHIMLDIALTGTIKYLNYANSFMTAVKSFFLSTRGEGREVGNRRVQAKILYLAAIVRDRSQDDMKKFIEILIQLKINLILCDLVLQIPKYVKYLKEMLTKKADLKIHQHTSRVKNAWLFLLTRINYHRS